MTAAAPSATRPLFQDLRTSEFGRLDAGGHVYLDYTGSALYPASLVRAHADRLRLCLLGNPHSENPASLRCTSRIAEARDAVLMFFGADPAEYTVVFTANASAAMKLVGESFPFGPGGAFVLSRDNHNSVNGIREFARARGARVTVLGLDDDLRLTGDIPDHAGGSPALLAFPAQSNFSGVQHPLSLIATARTRGYRVLLDAAAFVPTSPLHLGVARPDYLAVSFYKMFGWPTGIGALVARRDALALLDRPWFAGGTVEYVSVEHGRHQFLTTAEAFEDGTPNFLAIDAVPDGLSFLGGIGMETVQGRLRSLTGRLLELLRPMVTLYGPADTAARGPTITCNIRRRNGSLIPYWDVERAAARANISVRGGCFCNPGASERAFDLDPARTGACLDQLGPGRFTPEALSACLNGRPVGAIRISLGIPTTETDLERLLSFVHHLHES